ncbi:protein of unknown function DUF29 [Pasteurella testudinis DSM 23072]|uniref:DUF29 domain-containing protein n=1 Tax=Pasteurella testudinis DSM 23072 TaxID=1122938 RepID=A0A1W1UWM0_9PAST|nr:DUF29 domain-containing protein [Pasteurella testudinis]SMB85482.1 protein of unknown function DUF29 [Pasteurella testudinis DSM 23072]SUB51470.1 Domain of uncharacterised function DUF29 [Pasteurella testudinis]
MSITYNTDYYGWIKEQTKLLKAGALDRLDIENLTEEMESMGRKELSELRNRLRILIAHLLKWKYQPSYRGQSWSRTIVEQRFCIEDLIEDSPSLKHEISVEGFIDKVWKKAVDLAARETGLTAPTFPKTAIWTLEEILDPDFLP